MSVPNNRSANTEQIAGTKSKPKTEIPDAKLKEAEMTYNGGNQVGIGLRSLLQWPWEKGHLLPFAESP